MGNVETLAKLDRLVLVLKPERKVEKKPVVLYNAHNIMGQKELSEGQYPDEVKLKELLAQGEPYIVPIQFLHGRQEKGEFSRRKRLLAERELATKGIRFLLEDPIVTCAIPNNGDIQIVIIDGHHRTRYAPEFGIREIPSLIFTPHQLTDAFNARFSPNSASDLTTQELIKRLQVEVDIAQASFRTLPEGKRPALVKGTNRVEDLPFKKFQIKVK